MTLESSSIPVAWEIAKTVADISKKLYEYGKSLTNRDEKQKVDEILDQVRALKQSASELEDENRDLREKLRFKAGEYEFKSPFWYRKSNQADPFVAYCPKCFARGVEGPMGEAGRDCSPNYRRCLVCGETFETGQARSRTAKPLG